MKTEADKNRPPGAEISVNSRLRHIFFELLIDQITDYSIFLLTRTGEVATWNPGAQRIKGYKPQEIIGKHFRVFYPPQAQADQIPERELQAAAATGRFEDEGWRVRQDGSRFWANVIITPIHDEQGKLVGFGKVIRDLTERKRSEEQLRVLSRSLLKLQDDERRRLGRELHDSIGQDLAAVKMSLDNVVAHDPLDPKVRHHLDVSLRLIESTIREVRTLSYLLYPPMLEEMGLASAIRWHLEGFTKRSGIQTECERCDDVRLEKDVELALFRVFQESLTNVHRHSQSKIARVRFMVQDHTAVLEVSDEGVGLRAPSVELNEALLGQSGVGVRGMYERIRQLGGELSINSTAAGTTVRASVQIAVRTDAPHTSQP